MRDKEMLKKVPLDIQGHCRVDYTDPITGKVLERIEGKNHVFVDQFLQTDFQGAALYSNLVVSSGNQTLDTDLPWIPGKPVGYGSTSTAATGIFQGAYRGADSYINRLTQNGVESLYVYDFLSTQIPDTINFVGLTAQNHVGVGTTPFRWAWPTATFSCMYDIERKKYFWGSNITLSTNSGGAGNLVIGEGTNIPGAPEVLHNVFALCGSPDRYFPQPSGWTHYGERYEWWTMGYDYERQRVILFYTCCEDSYKNNVSPRVYRYDYRDTIWIFSTDFSQLEMADGTPVEEGQTYSYQYEYYVDNLSSYAQATAWANARFPYLRSGYVCDWYARFYNGKLHYVTDLNRNRGYVGGRHTYYHYVYDITTGEAPTVEQWKASNNHIMGSHYPNRVYFYKNYMWHNGSAWQSTSAGWPINTGWGFTIDYIGILPMYDIYNDEIYTWNRCTETAGDSAYANCLMQKGGPSLYADTWIAKANSVALGAQSACTIPYAYTCYTLPADAPVRPEGSAVTIAYGLTVNW